MADLMVGAGGPPPTYEPYHLEVGGVGQGSQQCHQKVTHNVVRPTTTGPPVASTFSAPEVESDRVPAILGLKTLTRMRAMMDMDPKHPRLIVPGPGGVQLQCAPGTVIYPLEPTHSGHLLLPCSDLDRKPGEDFITLLSGVHGEESVGSQLDGAAGRDRTPGCSQAPGGAAGRDRKPGCGQDLGGAAGRDRKPGCSQDGLGDVSKKTAAEGRASSSSAAAPSPGGGRVPSQ